MDYQKNPIFLELFQKQYNTVQKKVPSFKTWDFKKIFVVPTKSSNLVSIATNCLFG